MDEATMEPERAPRRRFRITLLSLMILVAVAAWIANRGFEQARARRAMVSVAYPVGDLISTSGPTRLVLSDFDPVVQRITAIEPRSWEGAGGYGKAIPFFLNQSIIVQQTPRAHARVVEELRRMRHERRSRTPSNAPGA
jgi:hypothetical protein